MSKEEEIDYGISCKKCKRKGYVMCHCDKSLKTKEELAKRATKLFTPNKGLHHVWTKESGCIQEFCVKCDLYRRAKQTPKQCSVQTPIDINWDNAMMLFREADVQRETLMNIWIESKPHKDETFFDWTKNRATPADYIEAACIAKEAENGQ